VTQAAVVADLLQPLQVLAHLGVQHVGHNLREAAVLAVLLPRGGEERGEASEPVHSSSGLCSHGGADATPPQRAAARLHAPSLQPGRGRAARALRRANPKT
jgi:hypothetical protein